MNNQSDTTPNAEQLDEIAHLSRCFLASIIANRINDFGWDDHVNDYEPEMLFYIAEQLPSHAVVLVQSAVARIEAREASRG